MGFGFEAVSNLNTQEALALPEKEVIQPHLPVRLPCYDFTPVTRRRLPRNTNNLWLFSALASIWNN